MRRKAPLFYLLPDPCADGPYVIRFRPKKVGQLELLPRLQVDPPERCPVQRTDQPSLGADGETAPAGSGEPAGTFDDPYSASSENGGTNTSFRSARGMGNS